MEDRGIPSETPKREGPFSWTVRQSLVAALLFVALSHLVFAPVLDAFFLSDDFGLIGRVASGSLGATWGETHGGFLRPLTVAAFWLDYSLWGLNPLGFHVTNTTLHGLNAYLVAVVTWLLRERFVPDRSARRRMSLASGFLFLLLPCHSEAVAWISGRTDLLAAFFGLISVAAFLHFQNRPATRYLVVSGISFSLALLAKESVLSLPAILVLAAIAQSPGNWRSRRLAAAMGMYALVLVAYLLARLLALGTPLGGYGTHGHLAMDLPGLADRLTRYVVRAITPPLGFDMGPAAQTHWRGVLLAYTLAAAGIGAAALARWRIRSFAHGVLLLAACFLVSLIPVFTLVVSTINTQGERFLYFPSAFAAMGMAFILVQAPGLRYAGLRAAAIYAVVCAYFLVSQNLVWREAGTLSERLARGVTATAESTTQPVIVVNVPADLRGAYVYQNGLPDAVELLRTGESAPVRVLSAHSIQSVDETMDVEWNPAAGTCSVRLSDPRSRFIRLLGQDDVLALTTDDSGYAMELQGISGTTVMLRYNAGTFETISIEEE